MLEKIISNNPTNNSGVTTTFSGPIHSNNNEIMKDNDKQLQAQSSATLYHYPTTKLIVWQLLDYSINLTTSKLSSHTLPRPQYRVSSHLFI